MTFADDLKMARISGILSILLLCTWSLNAQVSISGTINSYDRVNSRSAGSCGDSLIVFALMNYAVGDLLLFYNPGDATFNTANNANFGDSINLNRSGTYSFAYVSQVSSPTIILDRSIGSGFGSGTNIVKVPEYAYAEVTNTLDAPTYLNGIGGILALRAERLKLSSDIDISGKGFRGGNNPRNMGVGCGTTGYVFPALNNGGAPKGYGITTTTTTVANGRGHILNGGGGGNNHNAGGGGGSSGGNGGQGGDEWSGCTNSIANGGIGGQALLQSQNRLFFGGGGGSGHNNVSGLSSEGGHGGGIVILLVDTLEGNGGAIRVNGDNGKSILNNGAEGAGGGGAGGSIYLALKVLLGNVDAYAEGGDGGDVTGGIAGPGGGGSGGFIYSSNPANTNYSGGIFQGFLGGGDHGNLANGTAYGSTDGMSGVSAQSLNPSYPVQQSASGGPSSNFLGNDTTICSLDSILLSASAGATSYIWNTGDTTSSIYARGPGLFWVQYFSGSCVFGDSINIQVFNGGTGSFLGPDRTLCADSSIVLSTTVNGSYIWNTGATTNSITVRQGGWYWLNVRVGNGCPVRDSIFVQVDDFPTSAISIDTSLCPGSALRVEYPSNLLAFWPDGSAGQQFDFRNEGDYIIRVQNGNSCARFDTIKVEVISTDSIFDIFEVEDTLVCAQSGYPLNFLDLPGDLFWNDGRGSKRRTLYRPGRYIIRYEEACLTILDTLELMVENCDTCSFIMPNAFTPNGDGINDFYELKSQCDFESFELSLSDRWGERVFFSMDPSQAWDGNFKGQACKGGIYLYDLTYKLPFKDTQRLHGTFLLVP